MCIYIYNIPLSCVLDVRPDSDLSCPVCAAKSALFSLPCSHRQSAPKSKTCLV